MCKLIYPDDSTYAERQAMWQARQDQAAKERRAYERHRTRNSRKKAKNAPGPDAPARGVYEPYYAGGLRIMLDGAPMRVAAHVKDWSARSKGKISAYLTTAEYNFTRGYH